MEIKLLFVTALLWFGKYVWVVKIFLTFLLFVLIYKVIVIALKSFQRRFRVGHHWTIEMCLRSLNKPLRFLFVALCCVIIADIINTNTMLISWFAIGKSSKIIFVVFLAWCMIRFIQLTQERMLYYSRKVYDKTAILALGQIGIAIIIAISVLFVLQVLGVNFAGLLAFGGFSGIAVGFAAKDLLANFFGGIMIYMGKMFKVGDWIRSPDKEIEGVVDSIGWRQTKIITFEQRPIYVPNSVFSTIVVENPSRMTHRRLNEVVGIRYDDIGKANEIVEDIKELLVAHVKVDNSQTLVVSVLQLSASSVDIMIYCFTTTLELFDYSQVKHGILLGTAKIIKKHGAEIAFPTSTVHLNTTSLDINS